MIIPPLPEGLEAALTEHVFSRWDQAFVKTPAGVAGIREVLVNRFENALRFSVPWLSRCIDLPRARVVEIGCGSGSSTAAIALHAREVVGLDIDGASVRAAEARLAAYGLSNARVIETPPADLLDAVRGLGPADVYMLYAVLEHQTYAERLECIRVLWDLLAPGGFLVVIETPNRLLYMDQHTTDTEFFHLLPDELAFRYINRIKRVGFRDYFGQLLAERPESASLERVRWGLGASYHEFEIALAEPLDELIVADGLEEEMLNFFPVGLEEELLTQYFRQRVQGQPMGFARCVLNLILRRPASDEDRRSAARFNAARREVTAEPVIAEPVIAEPVIAEPVIAEPVIAEPVIVTAPAPRLRDLIAARLKGRAEQIGARLKRLVRTT